MKCASFDLTQGVSPVKQLLFYISTYGQRGSSNFYHFVIMKIEFFRAGLARPGAFADYVP